MKDDRNKALPKKKRVQTLDDIRREYNKGIGDFKNFEEYQDYMAERDLQIQQIRAQSQKQNDKESIFFDKYGRPKIIEDSSKPDDMQVVFNMMIHPKKIDNDALSNNTFNRGFSTE